MLKGKTINLEDHYKEKAKEKQETKNEKHKQKDNKQTIRKKRNKNPAVSLST